MNDEDVRYCIVLRSKYTGEEIVLGVQYKTTEEAYKYISENVCERCNSASLRQINVGMVWKNKENGFVWPKERV